MAERNIVAALHRGEHIVWIRRYARIDTAVPRCTQLALLEGHPRDVVELSHAHTGMQLGTITLHVNNKLTASWAWG